MFSRNCSNFNKTQNLVLRKSFTQVPVKRFSNQNLNAFNGVLNQASSMLDQHKSIIQAVSSVDYTKQQEDFFNATIGSHIRHSLSHFSCALNQEVKILQYDIRVRGSPVEYDRNAALSLIHELVNTLNDWKDGDVTVEFMANANPDSKFQLASTRARELSFASHHAIHHLAMVKVMAQKLGTSIDNQDVGIAPSTLNYFKSQSSN